MTERKPKQLTAKQARSAALKLHSLIVRHNNDGCQAKGLMAMDCSGPLQCAHIVPKKHAMHVMLLPRNGWVLCATHHWQVDHNQAQWARVAFETNTFLRALDLQKLHDEIVSDGPTPTRVEQLREDVQGLRGYCLAEGVPMTGIPAYVHRWAEHYG